MNENNFIVVQGWMCQLGLKSNELLIYALIYGFSQDGQSEFHGSRAYIAGIFNISLPTVDKALKNLVDKELVFKRTTHTLGVDFNSYRVNQQKTLQGIKNLYTPCKETLLNNIDNNIDNNTNSKELVETELDSFLGSVKKEIVKKDSLYSKCVAMIDEFISKHNAGNNVRQLLVQYLHLRLEMKDKPIYANQWKGLLNKLEETHLQGFGYEPIIKQSIEKGYASFYPVNAGKGNLQNQAHEQNLKSETYTDEEKEQLKQLTEDRIKSGKRAFF